MSVPRRLLEKHPEFITEYNNFSPLLQSAVATVLGEQLGTPVDPNTLPAVRFVDNQRTRDLLPELKSWKTPFSAKQKNTPFGNRIVEIEVHPEAIAKRAEDIQIDLGVGKVRTYKKNHGINAIQMGQHLLDQSAAQILVNAMLTDTSQGVDRTKILAESFARALDVREAGKEKE